MVALVWGSAGAHYFETGVDRGVLYVPGHIGVPWNGLRSVNESSSGGEARPYYIDGYKYLNVSAAEEYSASIEAFSSPREFWECDGTASIHNGLFATQQPRKPFSFSYRTRIGNELDGVDHGYKIHLVYNALASPANKTYVSNGASVEPTGMSWGITTTPPLTSGIRPTAHFVIDSRLTPPKLMTAIEDILYGSEEEDPRMPEVDEIRELFSSVGPISRRNAIFNPSFEVDTTGWSAPRGTLSVTDTDSFIGEQSIEVTVSDDSGPSYISTPSGYRPSVTWVGDTSIIAAIKVPDGGRVAQLAVIQYDSEGEIITTTWLTEQPLTAEEWTIVDQTITLDPLVNKVLLQVGISGSVTVGFKWLADRIYVGSRGGYFDGDTVDPAEMSVYEWEDTPHLSPSIERSWY